MNRLLLSLSFLLTCFVVTGQNPLDHEVTLVVRNVAVEDALYKLIDQNEVKLIFTNDILPKNKVSIRLRRVPLGEVLKEIIKGTNLRFKVIGAQVILYKDVEPPAAKEFTISGFLDDSETGERLIGASIFERNNGRGAITNAYGFYSMTLPAGPVELTYAYLGYEATVRYFILQDNYKENIGLFPSLTLTEVLVIGSDSAIARNPDGSSTDFIQIDDVNWLPKLAGESDLVRTTYLLPGVQTGTDGVGGIHVRGGNPGQNLILIDGVPVYNISHAAGVFSIFNTNAIRTAKLIKGGFPARYGGRISSVLDIRTKEGNKKDYKAQADLGMLTSGLSVEGPIIPDKSSFFVSGRGSFLNLYLQPLSRREKANRGEWGTTSYSFYDVNAKLNYTFSDDDRIYLSYYRGNDRFGNSGNRSDLVNLSTSGGIDNYRIDQGYSEKLYWGNQVGAFRWNHLLSDKLFANAAFTYSNFNVAFDYTSQDSLVNQDIGQTLVSNFSVGQFRSSIEDIGLKLDFDFFPRTHHYLRFGVSFNHQFFNPGILFFDNKIEDEVDSTRSNDLIDANEYAAYLEHEFQWGKKLFFNIGLRAMIQSVNSRNYRSLQPRFNLFWQLSKCVGLKTSYSNMVQFVHLLSSSSIGLPTDLWVPSTAKIRPQEADQINLGAEFTLAPGLILEVETYYKWMNHLLAFSEGAFFLNDWQDNVTSGKGTAYGIEFYLKKQEGRTTGWIAYGLAKTDRQFERIYFGQRYPFKYDRRHDLKIIVNHQISKKWAFSATWVLSSGFAYTLPLEKYTIQLTDYLPVITEEVFDNGEKNGQRMPFYHHLDFTFNYVFKTGKFEHNLNLGVYNVYNRRNPLYNTIRKRYLNQNDKLLEVNKTVQVLLVPITPSIHYSIKF
ncbi:MAG: TonB-dependent receptor [Saprospiraceae bacterium]|nr:MAG: TonB-dependent receptor [Saprospiraceae bacterium]